MLNVYYRHAALQILYFLFYRLKVCETLTDLCKSVSAALTAAFSHIMSLSHFGSSCNISNIFIIILFVMVTHDQ